MMIACQNEVWPGKPCGERALKVWKAPVGHDFALMSGRYGPDKPPASRTLLPVCIQCWDILEEENPRIPQQNTVVEKCLIVR